MRGVWTTKGTPAESEGPWWNSNARKQGVDYLDCTRHQAWGEMEKNLSVSSYLSVVATNKKGSRLLAPKWWLCIWLQPFFTCNFQKQDWNGKGTNRWWIPTLFSYLPAVSRSRIYSKGAVLGCFFLFKCSLIVDEEQLLPCPIWVQFVFSMPLLLYFLTPSHHILPAGACHFSLSAWEPCVLSSFYLCHSLPLSW